MSLKLTIWRDDEKLHVGVPKRSYREIFTKEEIERNEWDLMPPEFLEPRELSLKQARTGVGHFLMNYVSGDSECYGQIENYQSPIEMFFTSAGDEGRIRLRLEIVHP